MAGSDRLTSENCDRLSHHRHHHQDQDQDQDQDHDQDQDQTASKQKKGRGKIDIKYIRNSTNRQVTYSKRRSGIFKKAKELEVLCDAKVSVIMVSQNSNRVYEFISQGVSTKEMIDMYQQNTGTDLWKPQYERMIDTLRQFKEKNNQLKAEIRHRMGHDLEDLSFQELTDLETDMSQAVESIRAHKYKKLKSRTEIINKKVKSLESNNLNLLHNYEVKCEEIPYSFVEGNVEGLRYEPVMALANGSSNLYAFHNGHVEGGFNPYAMHDHDLRLA